MKISWEEFKALILLNNSPFTFVENDFEYNLSIFIGQKEYTCHLKKINPDDVAYITELETSFKVSGNVLNTTKVEISSINVAGQNRAQSITTSASEALGSDTILKNRKILSITPTNGIVYWGFTNGVTTVNGTPIFKNQTITLSVGSNVHVYLIAGSTIDCRIVEGS